MLEDVAVLAMEILHTGWLPECSGSVVDSEGELDEGKHIIAGVATTAASWTTAATKRWGSVAQKS